MDNNEIYNITNETVFKYRKNAKRYKNIDIDILRRRFTAMILNAHYKKQLNENKYRYKFGGFVMYVNESEKQVVDIDWTDEEHSKLASRELSEKLYYTYKLLGLNKRGDKLITDIEV